MQRSLTLFRHPLTALDATAMVDPDLTTKWISITTQAEAGVVKAAIAAAGYTVAE